MSVSPQVEQRRPRHVRHVLTTHAPGLFVLGWFVLMATASLWLPAYNGSIDSSDRWRLIAVYLLIAAIAEIVVRARMRTQRDTALASLPALGTLAVATIAGTVAGLTADGRGSPLYLYFGVALWASWAILVVSSALVWRIRWNRLGLALTFVVAIVGAFLAAAQID